MFFLKLRFHLGKVNRKLKSITNQYNWTQKISVMQISFQRNHLLWTNIWVFTSEIFKKQKTNKIFKTSKRERNFRKSKTCNPLSCTCKYWVGVNITIITTWVMTKLSCCKFYTFLTLSKIWQLHVHIYRHKAWYWNWLFMEVGRTPKTTGEEINTKYIDILETNLTCTYKELNPLCVGRIRMEEFLVSTHSHWWVHSLPPI